jgi:hypothetical protein
MPGVLKAAPAAPLAGRQRPALPWEARRAPPGRAPHGTLIETPDQGMIAIAYGPSPTGIGEPGVLVAVAIGTTVPGSAQTTT